MKKVFIALLLSCFMLPAFSWSGYDWETNSYVDIGKGNLVRRDKEIEVFDYNTGEYKNYEVESIRRNSNNVELEVYDWDNNDYRTFEMDNY